MKPKQSYRAEGITVSYDPQICTHAAVCVKSLPAVFDVSRRKWIDPQAASPEEIAAVVARCPSGALQALREGEGERKPEAKSVLVQASSNGPLLVKGSIELVDEKGEPIACGPKTALCRCGATRNQPFCDGSHKGAGFRSSR